MNTRWIWLGVLGCWMSSACDPDNACDKGFYADHGYCYVSDAQTELMAVDANVTEDGGTLMQDPNATFGKPCSVQSDCGGVAPVCGGPMLPMCTNINCMEAGKDTCPSGWLCVDVTKYSPTPGVMSACVSFN
jgi:hypothetical protein